MRATGWFSQPATTNHSTGRGHPGTRTGVDAVHSSVWFDVDMSPHFEYCMYNIGPVAPAGGEMSARRPCSEAESRTAGGAWDMSPRAMARVEMDAGG